MDDFTEDHSKLLLPREWLVKVDVTTSTPYLFKFAHSADQSGCCILISDTKKVWTEVLPRKHFSRRWKKCNPNIPVPEEDNLASKILCSIHSASGLSDASFDIIDSPIADLSFELEFEGFKWRWDTFLLGPRTSSDIISKHLIMPLITMAHVAFYSADPVSELCEEDLEKVVDKIGRAARRSVDTHVKHTIAKPRIATSLQRVSALLGLVPDLPLRLLPTTWRACWRNAIQNPRWLKVTRQRSPLVPQRLKGSLAQDTLPNPYAPKERATRQLDVLLLRRLTSRLALKQKRRARTTHPQARLHLA
ncbi:hypothetical protein SCHPADRAFT_363776 [Schizopora paradoxa]|uniref:XLF-like N-terminal domain-containing protein n=1 Tax=Schizopora paradoxa TaxID=27342 RepID=A0A0H2RNF0_9AGAM|nr:hypothetical protein SCHPADRAFT_363776 [Schizopora paradoxa]